MAARSLGSCERLRRRSPEREREMAGAAGDDARMDAVQKRLMFEDE
jgi:hypothetical protein